MNSAAQEVWNTESLVACSFCNRRFLPEKLKIHNKSCTASNPARRVDEPVKRGNNVDYDALVSKAMESGMRDEFDSSNLVHCSDCGRNFNAVSFPKYVNELTTTYSFLIFFLRLLRNIFDRISWFLPIHSIYFADSFSYLIQFKGMLKSARKFSSRRESLSTRRSKE